MSATLPPDEARYHDAWLALAARRRREALQWRTETRDRLRDILPTFIETFGLRRVVLFGSLVRGTAGPGSDVDLLVEGLAPDRYWHACAWLDRRMHPVTVDLVPAEDGRAEIVARALAEGEGLHGP